MSVRTGTRLLLAGLGQGRRAGSWWDRLAERGAL